jgi:hypothetical protein
MHQKKKIGGSMGPPIFFFALNDSQKASRIKATRYFSLGSNQTRVWRLLNIQGKKSAICHLFYLLCASRHPAFLPFASSIYPPKDTARANKR